LASNPRGFDEIISFVEEALRPLDNFHPERRQYDPTFGAIDESGLKDIFEFFYAGAQRRLSDVTVLRGPGEMAVLGE
jgi:hypothetical protein